MKDIDEREKNIVEFFKAAFCVDGKVRYIKDSTSFKIGAVIELNDSKRYTFYIGYLSKKKESK